MPIKFVDYGALFTDIWCQKRQLCQLSLSLCPLHSVLTYFLHEALLVTFDLVLFLTKSADGVLPTLNVVLGANVIPAAIAVLVETVANLINAVAAFGVVVVAIVVTAIPIVIFWLLLISLLLLLLLIILMWVAQH